MNIQSLLVGFIAKQDKPILQRDNAPTVGTYRDAKHYIMLSSTVFTQLPSFQTP